MLQNVLSLLTARSHQSVEKRVPSNACVEATFAAAETNRAKKDQLASPDSLPCRTVALPDGCLLAHVGKDPESHPLERSTHTLLRFFVPYLACERPNVQLNLKHTGKEDCETERDWLNEM